MKTKNLFLLPALIAGLGLILAGRVTAQTFTTLHSFTGYDGNPYARLFLSGSTLYGTTVYGGSSRRGTVFKVNTDGTGFMNLHSFTTNSGPLYTNSDGAFPYGGLILSGNSVYGTAEEGGSSGNGTVFAVNTDGTGFTNLHSFTAENYDSSTDTYTNSDGSKPFASLVILGNTLYGTASAGGGSVNGTVFAINTDGTGFTNLHSFTAISGPQSTNSDGAFPKAGLILSGNILYGTTSEGGNLNSGTVFALNTDGTGFTNLYSFGSFPNDGGGPYAGLILSGNKLYGTTPYGGSAGGDGTVFGVNTDGTGYTTLYSFTARFFPPYPSTNIDGAFPYAGLVLSGNTLYGTAYLGGSSGYGTVFAVNTDGTGFTNLHNFTFIGSEGTNPQAGLIFSGSTLYGAAQGGSSMSYGTVFSISLPLPQLTIIRSGANVVLTWPTNFAGFDYTGFTLQSTTNLVSPAVWSTNSPAPVVFNGHNTVTNPISGPISFTG